MKLQDMISSTIDMVIYGHLYCSGHNNAKTIEVVIVLIVFDITKHTFELSKSNVIEMSVVNLNTLYFVHYCPVVISLAVIAFIERVIHCSILHHK